MTVERARRAGLLDGEHEDLFDRMIAAQAIPGDLTVMTAQRAISALGAKVIW